MKNINNDHNPWVKLNDRLYGTMRYIKRNDIVNKKILNIGCGFGWFELRAISLGAKSVVGIEITEDDLSVAKNYVTSKNVSFFVGSAIDLPFSENEFDTVVCWEVIEHIPKNSERKMFSEINRVLKPSGKLLLSTPSSNIFTKLLDPAWWLTGHRHYSSGDLSKLSMGYFTLESSEYRAGWWTIIGLLNMYISKWILRREPLFKDAISIKITNEYLNKGFANLFATFKNEK